MIGVSSMIPPPTLPLFERVAAVAGVNRQHLIDDAHRGVNALLEQFRHAVTAIESGLTATKARV